MCWRSFLPEKLWIRKDSTWIQQQRISAPGAGHTAHVPGMNEEQSCSALLAGFAVIQ